MKTILDESIHGKKVILRVDFNVTEQEDFTISDDHRIRQALPTIRYLLNNDNKLILISHLGQPAIRDYKYSLKSVAERLQYYLPESEIILVDDFVSEKDNHFFQHQTKDQILLLENIRFYPEEKKGDIDFAKRLSSLGEIYVNDAFGVSHRNDASIIGIPHFLPSYAGILLKKEIDAMAHVLHNPAHPYVAIIGGAKIKTKINLLERLMELADNILVGGALANTFLKAQGIHIGKSLVENESLHEARKLLELAESKHVSFILPRDVVVSDLNFQIHSVKTVKIDQIASNDMIVDIGPQTEAEFAHYINSAKTIVWNGPVGFTQHPEFSSGTEFVFYAITQNSNAFSVVGGGDTIAAIAHEDYLEKISHLSTGGGAMLEYIEKGTLPGIKALK